MSSENWEKVRANRISFCTVSVVRISELLILEWMLLKLAFSLLCH